MSSGSAAHTASIPSWSRLRPARVNTLRRIQVAAVCESSRSASGASQGASVGTRPGQPVELALGALHVDEHQRVDARDRAAVAAQPPAVLEHVLPVGMRRERSRPRARAASAASRSWVGPIHWAPTSTTLPPPMSSFRTRPPTRSRASTTTTDAPCGDQAARGAVSPASPAPITATSASRMSGSAIAAAPYQPAPGRVPLCCGPMASPPRTREEERRLNARTLAIASAASASAAAVTSQLWIAGTWIAAAVTPLIVALVSELLHRPTERIARAITSDRPALVLDDVGGSGPPRSPTSIRTPLHSGPSACTASPGARPSRRRIAVSVVVWYDAPRAADRRCRPHRRRADRRAVDRQGATAPPRSCGGKSRKKRTRPRRSASRRRRRRPRDETPATTPEEQPTVTVTVPTETRPRRPPRPGADRALAEAVRRRRWRLGLPYLRPGENPVPRASSSASRATNRRA